MAEMIVFPKAKLFEDIEFICRYKIFHFLTSQHNPSMMLNGNNYIIFLKRICCYIPTDSISWELIFDILA